MITRRAMLLSAGALSLMAGSAKAGAWGQIWQLCAMAPVIVVGVMRPPAGETFTPRREYVEVGVETVEVLKGQPGDRLILRHWAGGEEGYPSGTEMAAMAGVKSVLFLTQSAPPKAGVYYFSGGSLGLMHPELGLDAIRREVAEQKRILAAWKPNPKLPHRARVKATLGQIARAKPKSARDHAAASAQAKAFAKLEAMGEVIVPALIDLIDDRRPLPIPEISLTNNWPGAFEGIRHYGPKLMVDAIEALLNQLTGYSFGGIYNGGDESQRRQAVDGWRIYAVKGLQGA